MSSVDRSCLPTRQSDDASLEKSRRRPRQTVSLGFQSFEAGTKFAGSLRSVGGYLSLPGFYLPHFHQYTGDARWIMHKRHLPESFLTEFMADVSDRRYTARARRNCLVSSPFRWQRSDWATSPYHFVRFPVLAGLEFRKENALRGTELFWTEEIASKERQAASDPLRLPAH
jgi:hypothetical protein